MILLSIYRKNFLNIKQKIKIIKNKILQKNVKNQIRN